jgi:hypothetical protein
MAYDSQRWKQRYATDLEFRARCRQSYLKRDKAKKRKYNKEHYNSAKAQAYRLKAYYGSVDIYARLLKEQDGHCATCPCTPEENGKALAVDHDHNCCPGKRSCGKCIRGLLCTRCNKVLGLVYDDQNLVQQLLNYLGGHIMSPER